MRGRISSLRLIRAFSWLFVTVVVGGVIGTLRPYIDFPSLIELVLPHRLDPRASTSTTSSTRSWRNCTR